MGQQCGCLSDSAPRKLMHGNRVSAGKEKGHATAPFLVHEIPGIGIYDCRVALRGRAEYAAGTIPAAESIRAGEVSQATRDHRLGYYDHNPRIVVFGNSASESRAVADEIALNAYPNSSFFGRTYRELKRAKFFSERKPFPSNLDGLTR